MIHIGASPQPWPPAPPRELVDKHLLAHHSSYSTRADPRKRASQLRPAVIEAGRPIYWPRKGDLGRSRTASITAGVEKKVLEFLEMFVLEMTPATMKYHSN